MPETSLPPKKMCIKLQATLELASGTLNDSCKKSSLIKYCTTSHVPSSPSASGWQHILTVILWFTLNKLYRCHPPLYCFFREYTLSTLYGSPLASSHVYDGLVGFSNSANRESKLGAFLSPRQYSDLARCDTSWKTENGRMKTYRHVDIQQTLTAEININLTLQHKDVVKLKCSEMMEIK